MSFVNNWKDFGGKNQYVQWARARGQYVNNEDDFFTHPVVKQYYKNHIKVSKCQHACTYKQKKGPFWAPKFLF